MIEIPSSDNVYKGKPTSVLRDPVRCFLCTNTDRTIPEFYLILILLNEGMKKQQAARQNEVSRQRTTDRTHEQSNQKNKAKTKKRFKTDQCVTECNLQTWKNTTSGGYINAVLLFLNRVEQAS